MADTAADKPGLDDATAEAATILAEAIRESAIPGVLEFRTVAGALERAVSRGSLADLEQAGAAFDRLDGDVRDTIADRAYGKAQTRRRGHRKRTALFTASAGTVTRTD